MSTQPKRNIFVRMFSAFWRFLDESRRAVVNIIFLFLLFFVITSIFEGEESAVEDGSAFLLNPKGFIVEQKNYVNPLQKAIDDATQSKKPPQTALKDVLDAINHAATDDHIKLMVINTDQFYGAGLTKLEAIAEAIKTFKESGKPIIAKGTYFSQSSYYLAAQADEVYMDPVGAVEIAGYGRYKTYYKSFLDLLGVNFHVFKVGTYKSAVEPYIRDNMSDPAKEANLKYLNVLWDAYKKEVAMARNLSATDIGDYANNFTDNVIAQKGDTAAVAVKAKLVDGLKDDIEFRAFMIEKVGTDKKEKTFKHVGLDKYVESFRNPYDIADKTTPKVAVITAKGVIMDGKQTEGKIGGRTLAKLIERARKDDLVKAIVLRVDSPGGSAFASEIIRREILATKAAGKKVVVSMGTYAASGGYWISADADQIWARPTTLTGSIGIFGLFPTLEKPLNKVGIHRDGIGTTPLAGGVSMASPLSEDLANTIQQIINHGYDNFLNVVSKGRHMSVEDVNKIAQGRVWSGLDAKNIGLVDELGNFNDAIKAAANLAKIEDHYEVIHIKRKLSDEEKLMQDIFASAKASGHSQLSETLHSVKSQWANENPVSQLIEMAKSEMKKQSLFNDPQGMYANCLCTLEQ